MFDYDNIIVCRRSALAKQPVEIKSGFSAVGTSSEFCG